MWLIVPACNSMCGRAPLPCVCVYISAPRDELTPHLEHLKFLARRVQQLHLFSASVFWPADRHWEWRWAARFFLSVRSWWGSSLWARAGAWESCLHRRPTPQLPAVLSLTPFLWSCETYLHFVHPSDYYNASIYTARWCICRTNIACCI
jgi:hypothetical protein